MPSRADVRHSRTDVAEQTELGEVLDVWRDDVTGALTQVVPPLRG
jgi:hypothetical protein